MRLLPSLANRIRGLRLEGLQAVIALSDRRSRRGFSLIEILTVLAIVSIMAAVSLPSLSSLNQSNTLTAGGNDLADMAALAHDYAVSHNVMTALVGVTTSTSVPSSAQYRAFVVMASGQSGSNWAPVSKWMLLPSAVTMSSNTSVNTFPNRAGASYFTSASPFNSLSLNGASVTNGYAYQIFCPDGHMDTSASSLVLRVVTTQNQSVNTPNDYYDLVFNPMTGTVKINRP